MRSSSAAPGVRQGAKTISYEALCRQIGTLFRTGTAPVSEAETLEIFTFMEAADESRRQGGQNRGVGRCARPGQEGGSEADRVASPMDESSESLAGRVTFIDMAGFHIGELPCDEIDQSWGRLWTVGSLPRAFLQTNAHLSYRRRMDYLRALAERDLHEPAETKRTSDQLRQLLLIIIAHPQWQAWNHSSVADVLGITSKTVHRHMELLKAAFIIREMPPYQADVSKPPRKAPRYYYRDTGLLHALLGLKDFASVMSHPALGASWEGFCIEQIIRLFELDETRCGDRFAENTTGGRDGGGFGE